MRFRRLLLILVAVILAGFGGRMAWRHFAPKPGNNPELESSNPLHGDIYPDGARAHSDLARVLTEASRENKRIILDFGGNWCPDCRVLDIYFHNPANLRLLNANYLLVHINIGNYDQNLDIAAEYGVPLQKGVPALVVLDSHGQLLYSQRDGEFEAMGRMDPASVTDFLEKWKA